MVYKITKLERVTTSTGKAKINATLMGEDSVEVANVGIWADFPHFADLKIDDTVSGYLVTKGQWITLYPPKNPTTGTTRGAGAITKAMDRKEEGIEKSQDRKEQGIKIASTFSSAVECAIAEYNKDPHNLDTLEELIRKWRKILWFEFDNHSEYPPFIGK